MAAGDGRKSAVRSDHRITDVSASRSRVGEEECVDRSLLHISWHCDAVVTPAVMQPEHRLLQGDVIVLHCTHVCAPSPAKSASVDVMPVCSAGDRSVRVIRCEFVIDRLPIDVMMIRRGVAPSLA
jgi:hypothetical protein